MDHWKPTAQGYSNKRLGGKGFAWLKRSKCKKRAESDTSKSYKSTPGKKSQRFNIRYIQGLAMTVKEDLLTSSSHFRPILERPKYQWWVWEKEQWRNREETAMPFSLTVELAVWHEPHMQQGNIKLD